MDISLKKKVLAILFVYSLFSPVAAISAGDASARFTSTASGTLPAVFVERALANQSLFMRPHHRWQSFIMQWRSIYWKWKKPHPNSEWMALARAHTISRDFGPNISPSYVIDPEKWSSTVHAFILRIHDGVIEVVENDETALGDPGAGLQGISVIAHMTPADNGSPYRALSRTISQNSRYFKIIPLTLKHRLRIIENDRDRGVISRELVSCLLVQWNDSHTEPRTVVEGRAHWVRLDDFFANTLRNASEYSSAARLYAVYLNRELEFETYLAELMTQKPLTFDSSRFGGRLYTIGGWDLFVDDNRDWLSSQLAFFDLLHSEVAAWIDDFLAFELRETDHDKWLYVRFAKDLHHVSMLVLGQLTTLKSVVDKTAVFYLYRNGQRATRAFNDLRDVAEMSDLKVLRELQDQEARDYAALQKSIYLGDFHAVESLALSPVREKGILPSPLPTVLTVFPESPGLLDYNDLSIYLRSLLFMAEQNRGTPQRYLGIICPNQRLGEYQQELMEKAVDLYAPFLRVSRYGLYFPEASPIEHVCKLIDANISMIGPGTGTLYCGHHCH